MLASTIASLYGIYCRSRPLMCVSVFGRAYTRRVQFELVKGETSFGPIARSNYASHGQLTSHSTKPPLHDFDWHNIQDRGNFGIHSYCIFRYRKNQNFASECDHGQVGQRCVLVFIQMNIVYE